MGEPTFELFHAITDAGSGRVRKWLGERDEVLALVRFRNVTYPEVVEALTARGGSVSALPALWDGAGFTVGAEAIIARLQAHGDVGRAG
jgi:hypothetical protein